MKDRVLITGGAGFIGTHLTRALLYLGYEVSVLDNFNPQIHAENCELAVDVRPHVKLFRGDIRDIDVCKRALENQHFLVHLAAETGTGQSMYRVVHYAQVNIDGTATLMELLLTGKYPIKGMVVASSRAVYGEGAAHCAEHGVVYPPGRTAKDMKAGDFEPKCPLCSKRTTLTPTTEAAPFHPASFYGLTKQVQEQTTLMYAATLGINGFGLRYQNVYGPGQSLRNPYTGILAIFSNQARAGEPIYIFEDGLESRDFVYVDDVVQATLKCLQVPHCQPLALNIGTGSPVSVGEVASHIVKFFASKSPITVTGAFREGDIRHSCADMKRAQQILHLEPHRPFNGGIKAFLEWASGEKLESRGYESSLTELRDRGLMHG